MRLEGNELIALVQSGMTYSQIAQRYGYSGADAIRGMYHRELKRRRLRQADSYQPTWTDVTTADIPRYDGTPVLNGPTLVLSDIHFPTTRYNLLDLALLFGEKHMPPGRRQVLLLGDLVNFDAFSHHPHIAPPARLGTELDLADAFFSRLLLSFDRILYVQGNHEDRLHKYMSGALYGHRFTRVLTGQSDNPQLQVSPETRARVTAGGQTWHCTHQRNYSKLAGRVAREMALKEQANIIAAHQHHVSVGRDPYNRYSVIDCGGLFDQRRMLYAARTDSTSTTMANGFVFIDADGCGHLLTPYATLTNWRMWGLYADARRVIQEFG